MPNSRRFQRPAGLAPAFEAAFEEPRPSWERVARVGFAGAELVYRLTVGVTRGCDLGSLEAAIADLYDASPDGYTVPGRTIEFGHQRLTLTVRGTSSVLPADDGGVQSALLATLLAAAPRSIEWVETERWTDTPFEEPPGRRLQGDEAREYLSMLVHATLTLSFVEIDYFTGNANPCIDIELERSRPRSAAGESAEVEVAPGPHTYEDSVRARDLPCELFVLPGRYTIRAAARTYSVAGYKAHLAPHAGAPLWLSPALVLDGAPGDVVSLRVGVPVARRTLTDAEAAFFAQPAGRAIAPPPEPRLNIDLEVVETRAFTRRG
jgi:hypothetical protein